MAKTSTEKRSRAERLRPATKNDLLALSDQALYMSSGWLLYLNLWSMQILYELFGGTLTYVQIIPDEEELAIYIKGAAKGDEGAMELNFSDTRRTAILNLHYAAARFNKRPREGRRLSIPTQVWDDPDLGKVLKLDIGKATIVAGTPRSDEESQTPAAQAAPAAQTPPAADPGANI